jgi:hypothetical protein
MKKNPRRNLNTKNRKPVGAFSSSFGTSDIGLFVFAAIMLVFSLYLRWNNNHSRRKISANNDATKGEKAAAIGKVDSRKKGEIATTVNNDEHHKESRGNKQSKTE